MPRNTLSSVPFPSHIWARNSGEIVHPEGLWALRAMTFAAFRPKNNLCCQQQAERVNSGCQSWTWSFSHYPPNYLSAANPSLMGLLLNSSHVSTHLGPTGAWEGLQFCHFLFWIILFQKPTFALLFPICISPLENHICVCMHVHMCVHVHVNAHVCGHEYVLILFLRKNPPYIF